MKALAVLVPFALALAGCGLLGSTVTSELGSVTDLPSEPSEPVELSVISGAGYGLICRDVEEIRCIQTARQTTDPPADRALFVLVEIVGGGVAVICDRDIADEGEPVICEAAVLPVRGTLTTPASGDDYGLICRDVDDSLCVATARRIKSAVPANAGGILIHAIEIDGDDGAIVCMSSGVPRDDGARPVFCDIQASPVNSALVAASPAP